MKCNIRKSSASRTCGGKILSGPICLCGLSWVLGLALAQPACANLIKITIPNAVADGRIVAGAGDNRATVDFGAGTTGDALAALIAAGSGGVAMGNMVTYDGATGGGYVATAGSLPGATVMRMVMPPPPPPVLPPKAINIFGPDGGEVIIGKDGTIRKRFFGPGINIIGQANFSATDTLAQINAALFDDLQGQLPPDFSFQLESNGVSLVGTDYLFDVAVTDEIAFFDGGAADDIFLGAELTPAEDPPAANPEPSTLVLFSVGALGLLTYTWRRRRHAV
jgi:hypothetical protein